MTDGETKVHSLYGHPVSHSLSPIIFNKAFEKQGLNRTYLAFDVFPEHLAEAVHAAKTLGFEGFNVTMPHKITILPFLDRVDGTAEEIGSVNTVARKPTGLEGYNTDGEGAFRALKAHGFDPLGRRIMLVGAGGAARAIAHRLSANAGEIRILDRTGAKAQTIADKTRGKSKTSAGPLSRAEVEHGLDRVDLLVNATPISTLNLLDKLGISREALPPDLWLFDLAYDKLAEAIVGVRQIHPLEMLVQQAALSYEIWLEQPAPLEHMRSVLVEHNGGDWR